jgi:hypothetical protein
MHYSAENARKKCKSSSNQRILQEARLERDYVKEA